MLLRYSKLLTRNLHLKVDVNLKIFRRCLHLSPVTCVKKYGELEHNLFVVQKYFPEISQEIIATECKQTGNDFVLSEIFDGKSAEEILAIFKTRSFECQNTENHLAEDYHDNLVQNLLRQLPNLNDDQLEEVLTSLIRFPRTPNIRSKNFVDLWEALDGICYNRSKDWKVTKLLQFCYFWVKLSLPKFTDFTGKAMTKIFRNVDRLTTNEFIMAMFFLGIKRNKFSMVPVEMKFHEVIDKLNINEVGIICLAFFKTEAKLMNEDLIGKIYKKLIKEIDTIDDIPLVNILKVLRYSTTPSHERLMNELYEAMLPNVENFGLLACLHIAIHGTIIQHFHPEVLEKIVEKFQVNLKNARLKDIERITFAIGLYDFKSKSGVEKKLLKNIVEELKLRVSENVQHPKCFAAVTHYLSICGEPEVEFIKSVLKEDFIKFAYGKNLMAVGLEILCIDSFARINLKSSYDGPLLSERMRANINKFQSSYVPYRGQKYKMTNSDVQLLLMKEMLELEWGENILTHILPHYQRPDIIHCFDESGKSVTKEIASFCPEHHRGHILSKDYFFSKNPDLSLNKDKYRMVAVINGGWNFYLRNTRTPTGHFRMKLEQLRMIGYTPVIIYWQDWASLSTRERLKLLQDKMNQALES